MWIEPVKNRVQLPKVRNVFGRHEARLKSTQVWDNFLFCFNKTDAAANAGDVDHDGTPDLIIGAPNIIFGPTASPGQAVVFSGKTGLLLFVLGDPEPPPQQVSTFLGTAVAGVSDMDADGVPDLLVSATLQRPARRASAVVSQVFLYSGADARLLKRFVGPGPHNEFDFFGGSLAGPGDFNGDGIPDLLIGADSKDVGANVDQGRVYVYLSSH